MYAQDTPGVPVSQSGSSKMERYLDVRRCTEALSEPLETEDYVIQAMHSASPTKWHPAHTSWFFETFLLEPFAASGVPVTGNLADSGHLQPLPAAAGKGLQQMFGYLWEWTASPYTACPGFSAPKGALGEYNGKFMANQMVLRGGSCATPAGQIRASYRNFFYPHDRWQFQGLRLADDA